MSTTISKCKRTIKKTVLPEDIVLNVLCFCELYDILSFRLTCKSVNELVSNREVWLSLLYRLPRAKAPCLPPNRKPESYSIAEIKDVYIRAIRVWNNWNRAGGPEPTRRIQVSGRSEVMVVKLLPGAKHVLYLQSSTRMLCRDVEEDETVASVRFNWHAENFVFELHSDNQLIVALTGSRGGYPEKHTPMLLLTKLNMTTMEFTTVLEQSMVAHDWYSSASWHELDDEYVLYSLASSQADGILIINWKTKETVIVKRPTPPDGFDNSRHSLRVVNEHLIHLSRDCTHIQTIPMTALQGYWSKSSNPKEWMTFQIPTMTDSVDLQLYTVDMRITVDWQPMAFVVHRPTWVDGGVTEIQILVKDVPDEPDPLDPDKRLRRYSVIALCHILSEQSTNSDEWASFTLSRTVDLQAEEEKIRIHSLYCGLSRGGAAILEGRRCYYALSPHESPQWINSFKSISSTEFLRRDNSHIDPYTGSMIHHDRDLGFIISRFDSREPHFVTHRY